MSCDLTVHSSKHGQVVEDSGSILSGATVHGTTVLRVRVAFLPELAKLAKPVEMPRLCCNTHPIEQLRACCRSRLTNTGRKWSRLQPTCRGGRRSRSAWPGAASPLGLGVLACKQAVTCWLPSTLVRSFLTSECRHRGGSTLAAADAAGTPVVRQWYASGTPVVRSLPPTPLGPPMSTFFASDAGAFCSVDLRSGHASRRRYARRRRRWHALFW